MQHWGVSVTRLPWPRALWGGGSSHPRGCALGTGAAVCRTGPPRMAEAAGLGEGMKIFRTFIAAELIAASAYP